MPCYSKTDLNKRNSSAHRKDAKDALTHVPLWRGGMGEECEKTSQKDYLFQ